MLARIILFALTLAVTITSKGIANWDGYGNFVGITADAATWVLIIAVSGAWWVAFVRVWMVAERRAKRPA